MALAERNTKLADGGLPQEDEVMGEKPVIGKIEFGPHLAKEAQRAAEIAQAAVIFNATEQLAAKDREIAELQRQLKTWRAAEHAAIRKGEAIKRERDEARESVGRLWREVSAIVKDGDDIGYFSDSLVERLESALAATPEHLRFAEAPVDASRALTS
jgi:hypothetical protein